MNLTDIRRYEMLGRVRDFGAAHPDLFPAGSLGGKLFVSVAEALIELEGHGSGQSSSSGASLEGSTSRAAARAALQESMSAINRTARAVAVETPGFDDKFRLPRAHRDQALLEVARAFAKDAKTFIDVFVEHEMPVSFVDDLEADIADLQHAIRRQADGGAAYAQARTGIEIAMESGLNAVRRLDAVVANKLREDLPQLAAWKTARHIGYPRAKAPSAAETSTTASGASNAA